MTPLATQTLTPNMTVLVADTRELIQKSLSTLLTQLGCTVMTTSHSLEVLARLGDVKPNVILLGVNLPTLDGYELCNIIKSSRECQHLRVMLLSSGDDNVDHAKGHAVGCDGILTQPFTPEKIITLFAGLSPSQQTPALSPVSLV